MLTQMPTSGAKLCLLKSTDSCYQMPSNSGYSSGSVIYDYGINPYSRPWRSISSTRTCAELLCVEDRVVDVRPELFEGEVGAVDEAAGEPLLTDFGPGAVLGGVVERRDTCGRARTD